MYADREKGRTALTSRAQRSLQELVCVAQRRCHAHVLRGSASTLRDPLHRDGRGQTARGKAGSSSRAPELDARWNEMVSGRAVHAGRPTGRPGLGLPDLIWPPRGWISLPLFRVVPPVYTRGAPVHMHCDRSQVCSRPASSSTHTEYSLPRSCILAKGLCHSRK